MPNIELDLYGGGEAILVPDSYVDKNFVKIETAINQGSASASTILFVDTGDSYSVGFANSTVALRSLTAADKIIFIPEASPDNEGLDIVIKDCIGNAPTYPITVLPDGGTIDDEASLIIDAPYKTSVTLRSDGVSNWMVI